MRVTVLSIGTMLGASTFLAQPQQTHPPQLAQRAPQQWTLYKRDEKQIAESKRKFQSAW